MEEWLNEKRTASTRRVYEQRLRHFLEYINLAPEEYLKLSPKSQRSYALKYQNEQPEANRNTIYNVLTAVSSFLEYHDQPINWRRSRVRQRPDVSSHVFSNGDLSRMFAVADTRDKAVLSLSCSLGWEMSGVLGLKRKTVSELIDRAKETGEQFIYFKNIRNKTGVVRLGVINPLAVEWVSKWLKLSDNKSPRARKERHATDHVRPLPFSDIFDMGEDAFNRMLKRLAKKAQIKTVGRIRFHNIRKWVMSGLSRSGFNEWQTKFMVGKQIPLSDATYLQTLEIEVKDRYPSAYESYLNLDNRVNPKAVSSLSKDLKKKTTEIESENLRLKNKLTNISSENQNMKSRLEELESKSTDLEEIQRQMNFLKNQIADLVKTGNKDKRLS